MFELDVIAATVIGGTSLSGRVGRMTGTVVCDIDTPMLAAIAPPVISAVIAVASSRFFVVVPPWRVSGRPR